MLAVIGIRGERSEFVNNGAYVHTLRRGKRFERLAAG